MEAIYRSDTKLEPGYQKLTQHSLFFNLFNSNSRGIVLLKKDSCSATNYTTEYIIPRNITKISFNYVKQKYIIPFTAPEKTIWPFLGKYSMTT